MLLVWAFPSLYIIKAKEKYRGMFETQKSGNKTNSGEIGIDIRTHASPKVRRDQVSGGVSVLCWHATSVAYVLWKPCTIRKKVIFGKTNRLQYALQKLFNTITFFIIYILFYHYIYYIITYLLFEFFVVDTSILEK